MKKNTLLVALTLSASVFGILPGQAGILHKHPTAAGAAAGLAAHHFAKKGAAARAASGKRPNLAERHPLATGIVAGAAAHHMLKK